MPSASGLMAWSRPAMSGRLLSGDTDARRAPSPHSARRMAPLLLIPIVWQHYSPGDSLRPSLGLFAFGRMTTRLDSLNALHMRSLRMSSGSVSGRCPITPLRACPSRPGGFSSARGRRLLNTWLFWLRLAYWSDIIPSCGAARPWSLSPNRGGRTMCCPRTTGPSRCWSASGSCWRRRSPVAYSTTSTPLASSPRRSTAPGLFLARSMPASPSCMMSPWRIKGTSSAWCCCLTSAGSSTTCRRTALWRSCTTWASLPASVAGFSASFPIAACNWHSMGVSQPSKTSQWVPRKAPPFRRFYRPSTPPPSSLGLAPVSILPSPCMSTTASSSHKAPLGVRSQPTFKQSTLNVPNGFCGTTWLRNRPRQK